MNLEKKWTSQDLFDVNEYNNLITLIEKICKENAPEFLDEIVSKENISVGDDLSGQTIYLNIDSETVYSWLTTGQAVPIITTSKNTIDEGRIYDAGINRGVAINFEYDLGLELNEFLYLNYEDIETKINLKEYKLAEDFGTVTEINTESEFYNLIKIEKTNKKNIGDFLFVEDVQMIENTIGKLCERFYINYYKKDWQELFVITYEDLNRWYEALKTLNNMQKYEDYANYAYSSLKDKTYRSFLYKEEK